MNLDQIVEKHEQKQFQETLAKLYSAFQKNMTHGFCDQENFEIFD